MIIRIDGQSVDETRFNGENLEEILVELQEWDMPANRLIGEVRVNGQTYTEDLPHASVEVARSDIQTLELVTRTAEEIAMHFIHHGKLLVESLLGALPKITEMFRLGDEAEASEHYLRFLESLHLLVQMLDQVGKVMGLRFDSPIGRLESVNELLKKLSETLTQMLDIQEQTDWIYLADMLEYELSADLETLKVMLPRLADTAH